MNKRITSLLLCFVMVFTMLATAVPALAAPDDACTFTVKADKTSANPGETITFTIYMEQVGVILGLEGTLKIPSGLTYVAGSGKTADGIKTTLGWDAFDWTEESLFLNGYGSENYTATSEIALMTFQCTVDSDAVAKAYSVTFDEALAANELGDPKEVTVVPATVNVTVPHTHVYDQEVATAEHLKTTATCTAAAVYYKSCTCGENGTETFTSGSALGHDYTQKFEDAAHLKTAASNCTEHNIYWFDCSRCDSNAKNDLEATDKYFTSSTAGSHSFTQKIEDAAHYVAGTGTDCQSVKKYYFDCAYCDQIGTATWDSTTYGPHSYAAEWSSDADGHWHECSLCHDKKDNEAHTPGAAATETTPQKCTKCDYIITPALGHTHHMTPVAANPATCTEDGNKAYYVCSGCSKWFADAAGNEEITDHSSVVIGHLGHDWVAATCTTPKTCSRCDATEGNALGHDFADVWSSDASKHWHACSRCDVKGDEAEHTPDREAATETDPIKCSVCDYVITPALGLQEYTIDLPFSLAVKLTGDKKPAKETFKFEIYDLGVEDAKFEIVKDSITVENLEFDENGVAFIEGSLKIKVTGEEQLSNLTEGFSVRMVKGSTKGWTYASEQWRIEPFFENDALDLKIAVKEIVDGEISEVYANGMSFAVGYEAVTEPETPQTGDSSMMVLWIALFVVSGAGATYCTLSGADNSVQFHALKVPHTEKGKGAPCPRQARIKQKPWEHNTPKAFIGYYRPLGAICT